MQSESQNPSVCYSLLEAEDDDFGAVIWPLTHSEVEVAVDLLPRKQPHMMDLETRSRYETKTMISAV